MMHAMSSPRLTVRAQLALAFGGLAFLVLMVAGLSLKSLGDASERFEHYVNGVNARANVAARVRAAVDERAVAARNLVTSGDFGRGRAI